MRHPSRTSTSIALAVLLSVANGCADDPADRVTDVEGPRGPVSTEGPWPVDVVTRRDGGPQLFAAVDDAAFTRVPMFEVSARWYRGELPAAPVGARVTYYAVVGDGEEADVFAFEVVDPSVAPPVTPGSTRCELAWRKPQAGAELGRDDDSAPQAGVQTNVIIEGLIPDQTAGVLSAGDRRYAARALGGLLVFGAVDVPTGVVEWTVTATTPGGGACALTGGFTGR